MTSTTNARAIACLAALGIAIAIAVPRAQHRERVTMPKVPADLEVPAGNEAFLVGHAKGTQNYVCLPSSTGFAWSLFTPEATLFGDDGRQLITHFFSPNPSEDGTVRPTWQDSSDTSLFFGVASKTSTDASFVASGAIPWLLLAPAGPHQPAGKGRLVGTTFVQRVKTTGGVAPATGCAQASDVGQKKFVPYTADYVFYRAAAHGK